LYPSRSMCRRPAEFVVVVVLVLRGLSVVLTAACPPDSARQDSSSVRTCVEDLVLDAESRRMIEALRSHYEDFPTYCRYG